MRISTVLLGLALLASTACNRYYTAKDFDTKTFDHHRVAVLPFEMLLTGRIPKDLSEEQIQAIEVAESEAFQASFAHQVRVQGNRGRRHLRVDIQAVETTNSILREQGIDIRQSWREDPNYLAEVLNVDAVFRSKVVKERYLSDLESIGIEVIGAVLSGIFFGNGWFFGGVGGARTGSVNVGVALIDRGSTSVLFSTDQDLDVNWSQPANQAIDNICRRVARKVPYRVKK